MTALNTKGGRWLALTLILALVGVLAIAQVGAVSAGGGGCEDADASGVTGSDDLVSYTVPSGNHATGVCIKSGSNMFDNGHSGVLNNGTYEDGCYQVSGVGSQTVTVERVGEAGSDCQAISHIDVYWDPDPTDTPVPPTETPTDVPPTETPTEGPSPTPTDTPEVSPTPEPTQPPPPPEDPPTGPGDPSIISWLLSGLFGAGLIGAGIRKFFLS